MSFADEEEFAAFSGCDHLLPMITPKAVGDALTDFLPVPPPEIKLGWLAMAVRRSLAASIKNESDSPARKSNAEIRSELDRLGEAAGKTWAALFDRSSEADDRLWDHAFNRWNGCNALAAADDPQFAYNQFQSALDSLHWLEAFLRGAGHETEKQKANWRLAEERSTRVDRGRCLAPVYEKVFAQPVTANNWSGSKWAGDALAKAPTPFMDFYQRMVRLAFGEPATPDLSGVMKEACRLHRQEPYSFEGIIPGL